MMVTETVDEQRALQLQEKRQSIFEYIMVELCHEFFYFFSYLL